MSKSTPLLEEYVPTIRSSDSKTTSKAESKEKNQAQSSRQPILLNPPESSRQIEKEVPDDLDIGSDTTVSAPLNASDTEIEISEDDECISINDIRKIFTPKSTSLEIGKLGIAQGIVQLALEKRTEDRIQALKKLKRVQRVVLEHEKKKSHEGLQKEYRQQYIEAARVVDEARSKKEALMKDYEDKVQAYLYEDADEEEAEGEANE